MKKGETSLGTPRYYRSIFVASFFLAILLILVIQQAYLMLAGDELSRAWLVWNVLLNAGVVLIVLLSTYFVVKQLLARQAISEAKFRELAEQLPDPVFETNAKGTITFANKAASHTFGYSKQELKEMSVVELMAEYEKSRAIEDFQQIERDLAGKREYIARRRDGTEFPMLVDSSTIFEQDRPVGLRGVVVEITDLKRMEDELRRANAELKAYAHMVSHDLKNPLASIKASSSTLEKLIKDTPQGEEEDVQTLLAIQQRGIDRSERIISDLLTLAETRSPEQFSRVDISEVVGEVLDDRSSLIQSKSAQVRIDEDLGTVYANPTHMYQLFVNLITNACVHNDPGVAIEVRHRNDNGVHKYTVRDNGRGMPDEIIDEIFLPFVKGSETGDTGVGLSIVEKIVRIYHGTIRAYNSNGACFDFTLEDLRHEEASSEGLPREQ